MFYVSCDSSSLVSFPMKDPNNAQTLRTLHRTETPLFGDGCALDCFIWSSITAVPICAPLLAHVLPLYLMLWSAIEAHHFNE